MVVGDAHGSAKITCGDAPNSGEAANLAFQRGSAGFAGAATVRTQAHGTGLKALLHGLRQLLRDALYRRCRDYGRVVINGERSPVRVQLHIDDAFALRDVRVDRARAGRVLFLHLLRRGRFRLLSHVHTPIRGRRRASADSGRMSANKKKFPIKT